MRLTPQNNLFRVADLSEYTTLIDAIHQETEQKARIALVDELESYLKQEMPFIPLWFSRSLHVESKTVTGIDYPAAACSNENVWQWQKKA